jgi:hypothetical protein
MFRCCPPDLASNKSCSKKTLYLWRWYINITITVLDIIHRPVFYLKHDVSCRCLKQRNVNKICKVWPYLTGNTLRLRYDPNRLMLSIGLWRWYINISITILDIIYLKRNVSETRFCLRLQVEHSKLSPIDISNVGNTPTTKKGIIPHKKIKERKAHNNCLRKTSNNNRRKTKASTAHSSITTTLMD